MYFWPGVFLLTRPLASVVVKEALSLFLKLLMDHGSFEIMFRSWQYQVLYIDRIGDWNFVRIIEIEIAQLWSL